MEVEDLCLRCANMKAEAAMAQEQVAPLVARVKELEEELARMASDRDTFEQYRQLAERSLRTALSVVTNNLPSVA